MNPKVTPIRPPHQTELLDSLEAVTRELQGVLELDIAYETDHFTDETARTLHNAKTLLKKHGRDVLWNLRIG